MTLDIPTLKKTFEDIQRVYEEGGGYVTCPACGRPMKVYCRTLIIWADCTNIMCRLSLMK